MMSNLLLQMSLKVQAIYHLQRKHLAYFLSTIPLA